MNIFFDGVNGVDGARRSIFERDTQRFKKNIII